MDPKPVFCAGSQSAGFLLAAACSDGARSRRGRTGRVPEPQAEAGAQSRSQRVAVRRGAGSPLLLQVRTCSLSCPPAGFPAPFAETIVSARHQKTPPVTCFKRVFFLCEVQLVGRLTCINCFKITALEVLPFFLRYLESPLFLIRYGGGGGETNSLPVVRSVNRARSLFPRRGSAHHDGRRERLGLVSAFPSALK